LTIVRSNTLRGFAVCRFEHSLLIESEAKLWFTVLTRFLLVNRIPSSGQSPRTCFARKRYSCYISHIESDAAPKGPRPEATAAISPLSRHKSPMSAVLVFCPHIQ